MVREKGRSLLEAAEMLLNRQKRRLSFSVDASFSPLFTLHSPISPPSTISASLQRIQRLRRTQRGPRRMRAAVTHRAPRGKRNKPVFFHWNLSISPRLSDDVRASGKTVDGKKRPENRNRRDESIKSLTHTHTR